MPVIASALAAIIPITLYLFLIWSYNKIDREPLGLYIKNFFYGAIGAILLSIIGHLFLSMLLSNFIHNKDVLTKTEAIAIAPFIEEVTKGLFLFITVANRKFDNITDGIVYGGAIGLGFGMTENFLYFVSYGQTFSGWILLVFARTVFTAVMHCVSTATLGAFLGYAKFKPLEYKIIMPPLGLLCAIFIHFTWNFSMGYNHFSLIGIFFLMGSIIIFITTFRISIFTEKKIIFNELFEESVNGLIPENHLNILSSEYRDSSGWINENIRKLYVIAATTLAFRKMQLKHSTGINKLFYEKEVNYYREYIQFLLNGS